MYIPLGQVLLQKKYADNTYRKSFLFLNKHCYAIWQCRNHSSQVGGTTFTYIEVYGPTYVVVLLIVYEHASNPRIYVGNSCYFYVRSTAGYNWASPGTLRYRTLHNYLPVCMKLVQFSQPSFHFNGTKNTEHFRLEEFMFSPYINGSLKHGTCSVVSEKKSLDWKTDPVLQSLIHIYRMRVHRVSPTFDQY
jgi:hypothetical protein